MSWGDIGSSKSRVELLLKDRVGLDNIEDRIGQDNMKDRTSVYSFQIYAMAQLFIVLQL